MKKIILTQKEANCELGEFYKNVGKHLMNNIMGHMFDCRHIEISKEIQDLFYDYYKTNYNAADWEITMMLAMSGPKTNENLTGYEVEVDDKFMFVANYKDKTVSEEVKDNVRKYFEIHLPQYTVYNVYYKSNHDDDKYLYMVYAKKNTALENDYAVWSSWNERTQSLNHGHYDLTEDKAKEVLQECFYDCTGKLNIEV